MKENSNSAFGTKYPPRETVELRRELERFLNQKVCDFGDVSTFNSINERTSVGGVKWGVYAFFDYDSEPIYVGQTRESLGTRIRRHLTNQRTDAVAMSVLDPFEVKTIRVWPLLQYQEAKGKPSQNVLTATAANHLNSLEFTVFHQLVEKSKFTRILNEKDPPNVNRCELGLEIAGDIVSGEVLRDREHPDVRIARRSQTISRLAQIIAGRSVKPGLRRALLTQAQRLSFLAETRFKAIGGDAAVEVRAIDEPTELDLDDEG